MRKGDGSLVIFTTLAQWSVGITVCLAGTSIVDQIVMEIGFSPANPVLLALFLMAMATTVSFLHLGNPVNAPKALRNLATSWLSREILGICLYSAGLLIALFYGWRSGSDGYPGHLLLPASAAGLFLVWAMARVYRIPTIPAWDTGFTTLGFFSTTLSLGLVSCLLFDAAGVFSLAGDTRLILTVLLGAVLGLEMVSGFMARHRLAAMDTGMDGPACDKGTLRTLFRARVAILFPACLAVLFLALRPELSAAAQPWLYLSAALVPVQELAGRILFYSSYFRTGL